MIFLFSMEYIMKKTRFLSWLLVLSMFFTLAATSVYATETSAPEDAVSDSAGAEDSSADPDDADSDEADPEDAEPTAEESGEFSVNAGAAMLIELNSDTIVYALNPDQKVYPASLTKIMTVMLALELCPDLSTQVTVTETALEGLDPDGVTASLVPGEVIPMEELLYCMMLPSANDACNVVAEYLCGDIDTFVAKMNEKAAQLGCTGTHFANPDGLHDDNHYTTVRDLSLITRAALENEMFCTMMSTSVHTVPATNMTGERVIHTTNYLMSTAINPDYYYEKASGVKTGYTSKAGRCLISTAKQGDFYYLSIVTGCQTIQTESGAVVYDSFVQTKKLLEHGLNDFRFATVISQLVPVAQVPVTEAAVSSVVVAPASDVTALLPADYDESKLTTTYTLDSGESLQAPLTTDQDVGTITVYYDGAAIASTTVRPITAVEQHIIQYAARNVGHNLRKYIGLVILLVCVLLILLIVIRNNRIRRRKAAARRKKAEARRERKD